MKSVDSKLELSYKDFLESFSPAYKNAIDTLISNTSQYQTKGLVPAAIEYLKTMASDGKRLRPYLVLHSYRLAGGTEDITDILIAIELLHFFALIHDDIIDHADVRHDIPTAHTFLRDAYNAQNDTQATDRGIAQTILLGDLVFLWSNQYFLKGLSGASAEVSQLALSHFQSLIQEVIVGEMMDVDMATGPTYDIEYILHKNTLKSGNYTFLWPLRIGATLASAEDRTGYLSTIATALGTAFQAQDDLVDITQHSGKSWCGDIETGQQTVLSAYMLSHANKDEFLSFYNRPLTSEEKEKVATLLQDSGAVSFVQGIVGSQLAIASEAISKEGETVAWQEIISLLTNRKK